MDKNKELPPRDISLDKIGRSISKNIRDFGALLDQTIDELLDYK